MSLPVWDCVAYVTAVEFTSTRRDCMVVLLRAQVFTEHMVTLSLSGYMFFGSALAVSDRVLHVRSPTFTLLSPGRPCSLAVTFSLSCGCHATANWRMWAFSGVICRVQGLSVLLSTSLITLSTTRTQFSAGSRGHAAGG